MVSNLSKKIKLDSDNQLPTPILADEIHAKVQLVPIYVSTIKNKKDASEVVKKVTSLFPLLNLSHLKRVRSVLSPEPHLDVIICQSFNHLNNFGKEDLIGEINQSFTSQESLLNTKENCLKDILNLVGDPFLVHVPLLAPITRVQYEEASMHWPLSFYENKEIANLLRKDLFTDDDLIKHQMFMDVAVEKALENVNESKSLGEPIGCVIVDPHNNEVITSSFDTRHHHPLQHAVMNAIDSMANHQLYNQEQSNKLGHYLCRNYEAYITIEPCVMCSMALLHSRINRVFYWRSHKDGALGSKYKIHCNKSLNHRFLVFKNLFPSNHKINNIDNSVFDIENLTT